MKSTFLLPFFLAASLLLSACGGGGGPTLGPFPELSKAEGDAAFDLVAPTSKGPGAFTFTSSNPDVATISGKSVTITGPGTTTITATQAASGSYNASSTTTTLTVTARACITPATRQNNRCTAPATTATLVTQGGLSWMPVTFAATYANASAYCSQTSINARQGWRLPTELELSDLRVSGAMNAHGWNLSRTWSSSAGAASGQHKTVRLDDGSLADLAEADTAYVACVL